MPADQIHKRLRDFCDALRGRLFTDKTELIEEFLSSPHQVDVILRPRRYGKSMQLQMLQFFSRFSDSEHASDIF